MLYLEFTSHDVDVIFFFTKLTRQFFCGLPAGLMHKKNKVGDEHAMPGSVQELTGTLLSAIDAKGNVSAHLCVCLLPVAITP